MKTVIYNTFRKVRFLVALLLPLVSYQNCSSGVEFATIDDIEVKVCNGISCDLEPLTSKPGVTTILLALGDEQNDQLVINGGSAQLMAETVIRLSTPVKNPRILIIEDYNPGSEHPYDMEYVSTVLLGRYDVHILQSPATGVTADDLDGFDLVWFNNPGAPMRVEANRDALIAFKGGVVLQGDDLAGGGTIPMQDLTGLTYIDNGTSVTCNGTKYNTDNNKGVPFRVKLAGLAFTGAGVSPDLLTFDYGNDIDTSIVGRSDLTTFATARGSPDECTDERPVIVRYLKN